MGQRGDPALPVLPPATGGQSSGGKPRNRERRSQAGRDGLAPGSAARDGGAWRRDLQVPLGDPGWLWLVPPPIAGNAPAGCETSSTRAASGRSEAPRRRPPPSLPSATFSRHHNLPTHPPPPNIKPRF